MLTARTLTEAQVYVSLVTAADPDVPAVPPAGPQPGVNVTEGPEAWTFASQAGDITIPYDSERAATTIGARFGLGKSRLIDAAQWAVVSASFARRALDADMAYTGAPGQDGSAVELNWEFAADAVAEAIKFLPDGADEVPDTEIWTEYGRQAKARHPHLVSRAKLYDDLEYYRGTLEDFRALYKRS
ncbi:hypothetical protein [Kribbella solani]|uniref:Uncharacterized protein n=1 Tax=Kribbella solani TaxID=236067 RepID=A0A841DJ53_9ACTN|nr:hypothetical protein [Kribbella solani]MBB5978613.1 hypothetical protein [Kribbella solani]MDX2970594.1 hypothetical protein [Kribbella solani]MDX3004952.1 hypothetical protein [Kribbella solani]